jgi:HlyD family secretion protein
MRFSMLRPFLAAVLLLLAQPALAETEKGVGALARIEPQSRVVRVAHDQGPEAARVAELFVTEGQDVEKGALIARFSDYSRKKAKLEEAKAETASLRARLAIEETREKYAGREHERRRKLHADKAMPQNMLDDAERDWEMAKASSVALASDIASAEIRETLATEDLTRAELRAPLAGTILTIRAWPGERTDGVVAEMADLTHLDAVAEIYERDMPRVKAGQKATVRVPGMEKTFTGTVREPGYQVMKNDVNGTDPLADRDNRVVETRITLEGDTASLRHLLHMRVDVSIAP